jgi:hypothetical protein
MHKFNLIELNDDVKEQFKVKISNKSAGLENLDDDVDINRAWENTRQYKRKYSLMVFKNSVVRYELKRKGWEPAEDFIMSMLHQILLE